MFCLRITTTVTWCQRDLPIDHFWSLWLCVLCRNCLHSLTVEWWVSAQEEAAVQSLQQRSCFSTKCLIFTHIAMLIWELIVYMFEQSSMETSSRNTYWHVSISHKCHWCLDGFICLISINSQTEWYVDPETSAAAAPVGAMIKGDKGLLSFFKEIDQCFDDLRLSRYHHTTKCTSSAGLQTHPLSDLQWFWMHALVQCSKVNAWTMASISTLSCSFAVVKFLDRKAWSTTFTALCCKHDTCAPASDVPFFVPHVPWTPKCLPSFVQVILSTHNMIFHHHEWNQLLKTTIYSHCVQPSWSQQYLSISIIWCNLLAACFPMSSQSASILSAMSFMSNPSTALSWTFLMI